MGNRFAEPASADRSATASLQPHARGGRPWSALGLLAICFAILPRKLALIFGALIGVLAGTVLRIRRARVEDSMRSAGISVDDKGLFAGQMYRSLGRSLGELLWLTGRQSARASDFARFDDASRKKMERAIAGGRGVVMAVGHTGNWELAAAAIAETWPLSIVAKPMSVKFVDRFIRTARTARGIDVLEPRGAIAKATRALRRGEIVGMMIDQVPERRSHCIEVEFLCGRADVDKAPAVLAALQGAPIVVAGAYRWEGECQVLEVLAVLEPPAQGRRAWIDEATREATRMLDRFIHRHPREWLWMHRRWRRAPR